MRQQANAPVVAALQGQAPEISQRYANQQSQLEAEKQPLIDRYKGLLDEITRRNSADVGATNQTLSREYGARGLSVNDSAFNYDLASKVNPINQFYTGQLNTTTQDREAQLRQLLNSETNLTGQQTEEQRLLAQKIADLQAGNNNQAISDALSMYQQNQANSFNAADLALKQAADQRAAQLQSYQMANPTLGAVDLGGQVSLYNPYTGQTIQNLQKSLAPARGVSSSSAGGYE